MWLAVLLLVTGGLQAVTAAAQDGKHDMVVSGTVRDKDTGKKIENVYVSLMGTSVGTVTNADGYFSLKIAHVTDSPVIEFSHLGYVNSRFSLSVLEREISTDVRMIPFAQVLDESVIYGSARRIVEEALNRIPVNYPDRPNLMDAFYRETVQKGRRYISIAEAVMGMYKPSYGRGGSDHDLVHIVKARRVLGQKKADTLGVKVMDGPNLSLYMDVVKNEDALFDLTTLNYYDFKLEPSEMMNDRLQYVISFVPRVSVQYALFYGKVYIDCERLSFTRTEFSLDLTDREKAVRSLLIRKPAGLRFVPQEVTFLINYRFQDGRSYLSYMCNELRFKCDWKKMLFSSNYVARCEMVVVDREEESERISWKDSFRHGEVFYDMVEEYWSEDFWRDYNIIEPTESLENAVRRLKRQQ